MKKISVVAAVIEFEGKILCVQKGTAKYDYLSYKYEFPGGKVEVGESLQQAIIREIAEELDMTISVRSHLMTVNHEYPDFTITMDTFMCNTTTNKPSLTEHVDYHWLLREQLDTLEWAAADKPIVRELQSND